MEIETTDLNFKKEVMESYLPVLVDFWAPWCMPCKMMAPVVQEITKDYEGKLKVCKVNVDEAQSVAMEYQIMGIPTLAIFKKGELVERITGAVSKDVIEEKLRPHVD